MSRIFAFLFVVTLFVGCAPADKDTAPPADPAAPADAPATDAAPAPEEDAPAE